MPDSQLCPNCRQPLPAGALAGFCPACLLAQGAETLPEPPRPAPFHPPTPEELGRLFPQLQITRLLGAGGMGAVYEARQPSLDRRVALKILPAAGGGANFAERFNREARALARLNHPNIVTVHEFGQAGELHFFIMEFVDGANLRQLERAGRLSPREALQIIPQICDALQYAHDEGVVHRDIKPENVLVDRKGRVKIADFGLAKILDVNPDSSRLTVEGQVMGTPHYMAPEQIERPLAVDHRADIYSLGVVLYEMLTGDLPLGNFSPPSRKVAVDVRFDEVVLRALENDPNLRYQQASEVKTRVENIAHTRPAPPEPALSSPAPQPPRYQSWMGFAVVEQTDRGRSLHWRGVGIAFAAVFGLLTLVFAFPTALTGGSLLGWFGIIGWPSVVARFLFAAAMVAIGVGFTLQSRQPPEAFAGPPPRSWIVPSARRGWRIGRRVIGWSLVALAWCAFQTHWLTPRLRSQNPDPFAAQRAIPNPQTGAWTATLPDGQTIELLALGQANSAPNQWWLPNGTRVTNIAYAVSGPGDMIAPGAEKYELAFRRTVQGRPLPVNPAGLVSNFEPPASMSAGGIVDRDGESLAGGWPMRVAWPPDAAQGTIRLGFLLHSWRTIASLDPQAHRSTTTAQRGDPAWVTGFNHISGNESECSLTVVLGPSTKQWEMRVIAIDSAGKEHTHRSAAGTPTEGATTWTYTFPDLGKSQVKEFLVQVQPVHWVEFRHIALRPQSPAPGPEPAFGPMREVQFSEFLDLDTGRTGSPPSPDKSENPLAGVADVVTWMQEEGFDVGVGAGKLEALGVTIVDLPANDWETLGASQLQQQLRSNGRYPSELFPAEVGAPAATFGFRTREGAAGMLQLTEAADNGSRAQIRYKLVQSPSSSAP